MAEVFGEELIPFKTETVLDYCTARRIEETKRFVDDVKHGIVLDIGEENVVGRTLGEIFALNVVNINGTDFNFEIRPKAMYDLVFCFDVIEHLMNPLLFMKQIGEYMYTNGIVYLSTPLANKYGFMFNETEHFAEYREDKLKTLFEYAGFKVEKEHQFRTIPFWREVWRVKSLRSIVRALTTYTAIFKLRKI